MPTKIVIPEISLEYTQLLYSIIVLYLEFAPVVVIGFNCW